MKISDIVFEMETNYVSDEDIETIVASIQKNGFNAQKVDDQLVALGYDPIFAYLDEDGEYEVVQKFNHRKHLDDD